MQYALHSGISALPIVVATGAGLHLESLVRKEAWLRGCNNNVSRSASDVHIFIEPDIGGACHVVWRSELVYCACPEPHTRGEIYESAEMRSVEQKRATETDIDWPVGTRYLLFLDTYGNEVE